MRRIQIGGHEKDRHRPDVEPFQILRESVDRTGVERYQHLAVGVDPFGHLETQLPRYQRLVPPVVQVERVGPVGPGDLKDVAKPRRGDQGALGAAALDQ